MTIKITSLSGDVTVVVGGEIEKDPAKVAEIQRMLDTDEDLFYEAAKMTGLVRNDPDEKQN